MNRRIRREHCFKLLFVMDFHETGDTGEQMEFYWQQWDTLTDTGEDGEEEKESNNAGGKRAEESKAPSKGFFGQKQREEIESRLIRIMESLSEIDTILATVTHSWRLERLGYVERAILRLACYEIRFDDQIPYKVAVNEAVELAKTFGGEESPSFVNGVLAKLEG